MASEYTLKLLILAALERADMLRIDPATGSEEPVDFVALTAVVLYVNAELAALWDTLVLSNEDYCIHRKTIEIVSGQEEYSFPSDFYKFRKVFPVISGKRQAALRKFDLRKLGEADSRAAIMTSRIEESEYRVSGNRLLLHPVPTTAGQVELWYIPQFDPIVNLEDRIDFRLPFGWEQYCVEGVAARLKEKEDLDGSANKARQAEILGRIMTMVEDRDVGEPHSMQDTEGYLNDGSYGEYY